MKIYSIISKKIHTLFSDSDIDPPQPSWFWPALGGILFFLIWYLISGIIQEPLWYDETFTAFLSQKSWIDIWKQTGLDVHPPLYYYIVKIFISILGTNEFSLRLPSLLSVIGIFLLIGFPFKKAFGWKFSLIFFLVIAVTPLTYFMGIEARMYLFSAFLIFGTALYGYLFLKSKKNSHLVLWGIFTLAACYTHYFALLAVLIIDLDFMRKSWSLKNFHKPLLMALGCLVLYSPWIFSLVLQLQTTYNNSSLVSVKFLDILSYFSYPFSNKFTILNNSWGMFASFLFVLISSLVALLITRKEDIFLLIFLGIIIPVISCLFILWFSMSSQPIFTYRYFSPFYVLFLLPFAVFIVKLKKTLAKILILIIYLVLVFPSHVFLSHHPINGTIHDVIKSPNLNISKEAVFIHRNEFSFGAFSYYFPQNQHFLLLYSPNQVLSGNLKVFEPKGKIIRSLDELPNQQRLFICGDTKQSLFNLSKQVGIDFYYQKIRGPYNFITEFSPFGFNFEEIEKIGGNAQKNPPPALEGDLSIRVIGLRSNKGRVFYFLFDHDVTSVNEYFYTANSEVNNSESFFKFLQVPSGKYIIFIYHDEDNSLKLTDLENTLNLKTAGNCFYKVGQKTFSSLKFETDSYLLEKPEETIMFTMLYPNN